MTKGFTLLPSEERPHILKKIYLKIRERCWSLTLTPLFVYSLSRHLMSAIPTLFLRHLYYCRKTPVLFQSPQRTEIIQMPVCHAKNYEKLYKSCITDYTITKKRNRQLKSHKFDSRKLHIESLSGKLKFHRHKIIYALPRI